MWAAEMIPSKSRTTATVCVSSFDCFTPAVVGIYFLLISRDWLPLYLSMTILNTVGLLLSIFFIPESPHWLLSKGRVSEAIDSFNAIARFNGVATRIA